jgi:hypothetical protein
LATGVHPTSSPHSLFGTRTRLTSLANHIYTFSQHANLRHTFFFFLVLAGFAFARHYVCRRRPCRVSVRRLLSVSCSTLLIASLPSAHLASAIDLAYTLTSSPPEASLAELDAAMHVLSLARTALAARRVRAQTLPPELLVRILALSADAHDHARLLALGRVCRAWHAALLGARALWARPVFTSVPAARALLARAGNACLDVSVDLRPRSMVLLHAAALAMPALARTRHLSVLAPPPALGVLAAALPADRAAPALETLFLGHHGLDAPPLPPALAGLDASALRVLSLSDFSVDFNTPLFAGARRLTALDISRSSKSAEGRADAGALLALLQGAPALAHVRLCNVLPDSTELLAATTEKIVLHALETLSLDDGAAHAGALIAALTLPATATVQVTALAPAEAEEDFGALGTALGAHLAEPGMAEEMNVLRAAVDGPSLLVQLGPTRGAARLSVKLAWRTPDDGRPANVLSALADALPLDTLSLQSISVADVPMDAAGWRTLLRRGGDELSALRAEAAGVYGLLDALLPGSAPTLLAPGLRTLALARAHFTDARDVGTLVAFVRAWRDAKTAALANAGAVGAAEPSWETPAPPRWHAKLEGIELDRCGFAADEHVEILKSAGLELA